MKQYEQTTQKVIGNNANVVEAEKRKWGIHIANMLPTKHDTYEYMGKIATWSGR